MEASAMFDLFYLVFQVRHVQLGAPEVPRAQHAKNCATRLSSFEATASEAPREFTGLVSLTPEALEAFEDAWQVVLGCLCGQSTATGAFAAGGPRPGWPISR